MSMHLFLALDVAFIAGVCFAQGIHALLARRMIWAWILLLSTVGSISTLVWVTVFMPGF
jgi:hypothetical protein